MKRRAKAISIGVGLLCALVAAGGGYRWHRERAAAQPLLPEFVEPADGARAPSAAAFGVRVGSTRLADADALIAGGGFACKDTSIRALMRGAREKKLADIEERRARGEDVDTVSGASALRPSKRERNPQVRLSCEPVAASALGDRARPASQGRLLFVFDSAEHPLRHSSYQRIHEDHGAALADLEDALAALSEQFGQPTSRSGELPPRAADGSVTFARLSPISIEWKFTDVEVKLRAMRLGGRGVSVGETVEVPWPVRPDAPALVRSASLR